MKWTLAQLEKENLPLKIQKELSLSKNILNNEDVLEDFVLKVDLVLSKISSTAYLFHGNIQTSLKLMDAVTLEHVIYPLDEKIDEIFDVNYSLSEDVNIIENGTIQLEDILIEILSLNIPISFVKDKTKKFVDVKLEDEDVHPSFESLKDFFNK